MGEWKEYKLGDIVSIASGFAYKGEYIGHGDNLLLGMGCVSFKEKFLISGARPYCGDCAERYLAKSGDIVLATRQQSDNLPILGMPAIIPEELKDKAKVIGNGAGMGAIILSVSPEREKDVTDYKVLNLSENEYFSYEFIKNIKL